MRSTLVLAAIAASVSTTSAAIQGFNYGAAKTDGSFMFEADYKSKFAAAKSLPGASGFSSARLYTMIQGGSSTNEPTQAIPAAIAEGTSLLLGIWASGGQGVLEAEITALKSAISQYGDDFTKLVVGISVGNEDLYRISPTGIAALSGYGAEPDTLVSYIGQVRTAIEGTSLSDAQIGHVDTWTAWVNSSNNAVAEACDWIGFDAYPYFQNSMANSISDGKALFNDALAATKAAVGGKPVWITETGWPVSGKTENLGIPSTENAQTYWEEVGCPLFGVTNTWWFTLQDSDPSVPNPSFGIVGTDLKPLFDLSCNAVASSSSSSAPASSSTIPTTPKSSSSSIAPTSSTDSTVPTTAVSSTASTATTDSGAAISSGASSLSSEAAVTTGIASSGGGLSPSQGGGIVASSGGASATSTPTGSTGNGTTSAGSTAISTSSPSSTSIVPVTPGNSAAIQSGSFVAAIGAFIAAFVAL